MNYLHLKVSNEPLHGDFLFDMQEKAVAAEHHALQDVQAHLLYRGVGRLGVHKAGDLREKRELQKIKLGKHARGVRRAAETFLMKTEERFSHETIP